MDIGMMIGFVFTLIIFSYLLGDNWLYRLAIYVFVGLTAAFTAIVIVESVLWPLTGGGVDFLLGFVALVMALLLLLKPFRQLNLLTNLPLAFLIAVGAAVALIGALTGTLIPLVLDTPALVRDNTLEGVIVVIGVVTSLAYFQYAARRTPTGEIRRGAINATLSFVGQGFIAVTLGALYATAILTSLTLLVERISFLIGIGV